MKLNGWSIFMSGDGYTPPELRTMHIQGFIEGHPLHRDGKWAITSPIVGVNDGKVVTKSGSQYELGDVDPRYEAEYPDAKNRLLESLRQK